MHNFDILQNQKNDLFLIQLKNLIPFKWRFIDFY